ncbi:MAG: hypothetical protein V1875_03975 [Candidatus Altiarchaeota archaeon]
MTLVESTGLNVPKAAVIAVFLVIVFIVGALLVLSSVGSDEEAKAPVKMPEQTPPVKDEVSLKGAQWTCSNLLCTRQMTQAEWMTRYCVKQDDKIWCRIRIDNGTPYIIPIENLNLSIINECGEYICLQESLSRNASYRLLAP